MISEMKHDNSNQVIRHPDKDRVDKNFIIFSHERDHKLFVTVQREKCLFKHIHEFGYRGSFCSDDSSIMQKTLHFMWPEPWQRTRG